MLKDAENSKNELARYMFAFDRFTNHSKSRDICKKQIEGIRKKVKKLNEIKAYPMSELEFFEECAREIIACR